MIIAPLKQFLINVKLNNPAETATLYVQAIVKNAITGDTIATVNLDDNGGYYYSKLWVTPNDMSGTGLQVVIFKKVYTDSSYITASQDYGESIDNFIIQRIPVNTGGLLSNGIGSYREQINYEKIKELINDAISRNTPIIEQREVNIKEIESLVSKTEKNLLSKINENGQEVSFSIAEINEDFSRRVDKLVKENIAKIKIPELNLSPVISILERIGKDDGSKKDLKDAIAQLSKQHANAVEELKELLKPVEVEEKEMEHDDPRKETITRVLKLSYD